MKTEIKNLGIGNIKSPIKLSTIFGDNIVNYVRDDERIIYDNVLSIIEKYISEKKTPPSFEKAGPREKIYFDPKNSKAAIVTCGGLCPGLNNVIRAIVMQLYNNYGVKNIIGIKYGYEGFISKYGHEFLELNPEVVANIHELGGTVLASSRGEQKSSEIVDTLVKNNVNMLFCVGGDGTLRGASAIADEILKRNLKISVIGIPKTIDNDISYIEKTFGFETAFSKAVESVKGAHVEAIGAPRGIGIVKLMGRHSGFVASSAALACREVDFVLVPEVDFDLEGEKGLFALLESKLDKNKHAVVVVAEGAGQKFFNEDSGNHDASGNIKLKDIGIYLKTKIKAHFSEIKNQVNVKYIDPSYIIRSLPANPSDSIYCANLAQNGVHAAMAGKTSMVVGSWNNSFVNLPINLVTSARKTIEPESPFWLSVIEETGQPITMSN
jgi:6-phosphofructokinase 1